MGSGDSPLTCLVPVAETAIFRKRGTQNGPKGGPLTWSKPVPKTAKKLGHLHGRAPLTWSKPVAKTAKKLELDSM